MNTSPNYRRRTLAFETVCEGLAFPEGPVSLPDGSVLVVEIRGQRLTRVFPGGECVVVAALEGGPNGAALDPRGRCIVCNSGGFSYAQHDGLSHVVGTSPTTGWIEAVDLDSGAVVRLYEESTQGPLRAPNDLVFDRHGGFYFTDHGKSDLYQRDITAVYYAPPDGGPLREVARPLLTPNGIGLSPDGDTLYVAETQTRRLLSFRLSAPGVIQPRPWPESRNGSELLAGLPDGYLLDSLAVDSAGHIVVGSIGTGGLWEFSPDGRERSFYPLPDPYCTNICFDVRDPRQAYATLSGSGRLIRFAWHRPGLLPHWHDSASKTVNRSST